MIELKNLMDDLEVGNRVMEEIERVNTERKPKKFPNLTEITSMISSAYLQQAQMQQAQTNSINPFYQQLGGMPNGTI